MKRLLAWVTLAVLLLASSVPGASAVEIDSHVTVEISPNAELLGIVYYLAFGKDPFVIDRGSYLSEVEAHFGRFRNSTAVLLLKSYLSRARTVPERDYYLMELEYYLLLCSEPPGLMPMVDIDFPWFENEFLPSLREFANESDFMDFYESHMDYYDDDLRIYENALKMLPPDEFMTENAGVHNVTYEFLHPYLVAIHGHSFRPVLNGTSVWGAGGMLPLVRRTPQRTLWSYKTARDTMFGLPLNRDYVMSMGLDELLYLGFIYHELGHDITIPALDAYGNLSNLTYFVDAIRSDMPYLARYDIHFWSKTGMLYEGFADAWEDYAISRINENYTLLAINMQKAWGEFWIGWLLNRTAYYSELSRKTGKPFSDYVWSILGEMRGFASPENVSEVYSREVPVTPLRAFDRGAELGRVVIVYGTANLDPTGTEKDKETAEEIAGNLRRFYSQWVEPVDVVVKADVNVTDADLEGVVVLVGGPVSNRLVRELDSKFPLRFEKVNGTWVLTHTENVTSFVLLDEKSPWKKVYGNVSVAVGNLGNVANASVLMAIRNPYNESNYLVWVAGENRNLTALFTNPTYYLSSYEIYTGKEVEMGFYVQSASS
ncbi:DUF4932 domain-containing protein [Thermococcus henrietii]|uniref:DUF4932 domain-containing protein n=1 Tax=Thermococcus henrietii TaxID=2016361 RepID=UPI000C0693D7|nr:DUF4932 domain-containing protein [Thermococcus henrietii]